jgi:hypothetical protein
VVLSRSLVASTKQLLHQQRQMVGQATYARKMTQLITALRAIRIALNENTGARLAARLRIATIPATLLRLVRTALVLPKTAIQVVSIDEWAWWRGHCYGTILLDPTPHQRDTVFPHKELRQPWGVLKTFPQGLQGEVEDSEVKGRASRQSPVVTARGRSRWVAAITRIST